MDYRELFTEEDRAGLASWLEDSGELFVYLDFPTMPCAGDWWLVRSIDQLLELAGSVTWPQLDVTVYRQPQLTLRGIANADLRHRALALIPDGLWYAVREIVGHGPFFCRTIDDGETHAELLRGLTAIEGASVAVGIHPLEHGVGEMFRVSARRSRNRWPPYDDTPPDPLPSWPEYGGKLPGS